MNNYNKSFLLAFFTLFSITIVANDSDVSESAMQNIEARVNAMDYDGF